MTRLIGMKQIKEEIKICKNCKTIIGYSEKDIFIMEHKTYDSDYRDCVEKWKEIKCPNCGKNITIEEIRWRGEYDINQERI